MAFLSRCATLLMVLSAFAAPAAAQPVPDPWKPPPPPPETPAPPPETPADLGAPSDEPAAPAPTPGTAWDIPGTPADTPPTGPSPECLQTEDCAEHGQCTAWQGGCIAVSVADCRQSRYCKLGYCTPRDGKCVVGSHMDCRMSEGCAKKGWCSQSGDECIAGGDMDCMRSSDCAQNNACRAQGGRCVSVAGADVASMDSSGDKDMLPGAKLSGVALFSGGLLTAAIGSFVGFFADEDGQRLIGLANLMPLGGTAMVIGVPLWLIGATDIPADSEPRNATLLVGGTALAGLGASGMAASAFFLVAAERRRTVVDNTGYGGSSDAVDDRPLPAVLMTASGLALIGGAIMAGYGGTVVRSNADLGRRPEIVPNVKLGAGHAELSWKFY